MINAITLFFLLILASIPSAIFAEIPLPAVEMPENAHIFNENDYRSPDLAISMKQYAHGDLTITLVQVKRIAGFEKQPGFLSYSAKEPPHYCRAWLTVQKNNQVLKEVFYPDIHPVGSAYGLFVPKLPPSQEYFAIVALGGYNGRLMLIRKDGTFSEHLGGPYFITANQEFLFSDYYSDTSGLTVFDLKNHRVIFSSVIEPYIRNWYRSKLGYFFTETNFDTKWPYEEKKGVIHIFDFSTKGLNTRLIDISTIKDAKRIMYNFLSPHNVPDCSSQ
jgi:hypothetical protein